MPDEIDSGKKIEVEKISLRRFEHKDQQEVYALHVAGLRSAGTFTEDPEARIKLDADLRNILENYVNTRSEFLVAVFDGQIIGMGAIRKVDEITAEVRRMRVKLELQGRGIGKIILDGLIERAEELGYKKLILDVAGKAKAARSLYESRGFKEYKRGVFYEDEAVYYSREI